MNLNQITVPSLYVTASFKFYKMLRLKLIVKALPKYASFESPNGNSTFSILLVDHLPKGIGVLIYFECRKLDETKAHLI